MTATDEVTDWRKLREFAAVNVEQSFVLSWHLEREILFVDVDLRLTSEHPFYEEPRPAEKVCIRPAVIEFPVCENIELVDSTGHESRQEGISKLGLGAINGLRRLADGRYEIEGQFGVVRIDAERPLLRLKGR